MAVQQLPLDLGIVIIPAGGFITCKFDAPVNQELLINFRLLEETDLLVYFESNNQVVYRTTRTGHTGGYSDGFNTNDDAGPYTVYILNQLQNSTSVEISFSVR